MSQSITFNNFNDATTSRRFTGFPLNSTLVSSYTPDTIRSIISQAATGQPYSTAVWIRLNRAGIQISAQDAQVARARIPVFIPIGLTHDIFMLPSVTNVICIVYDEIQSNMKGVLLYVVHPSDAQAIREDFRLIKQGKNGQQSAPNDNRYSSTNEIYPLESNQLYTPLSSKSPLVNKQTIRQPSPRRLVYVRDYDSSSKRDITPTLPQLNYIPSKGSYHSDHRRNRSPRKNRIGQTSPKRSNDNFKKKERKNTSRSPEKRNRTKLPASRSSPDLTVEQSQQQQQQQQQLLLQQQLFQQQQRMAAWQPGQPPPLIPMGIYNRYVPKTIPLPTGETLKTTLPLPGAVGPEMNGTAVAYIEPMELANTQPRITSRNRSRSPSPLFQQQSRPSTVQSVQQPSRRHHTSQSSQIRSRDSPSTDDETKRYIKLLVEEMQAMKMEMSKLQQTSGGVGGGRSKGRSDSLQIDLKDIRSHIDLIRARMAMTPRATEKPS